MPGITAAEIDRVTTLKTGESGYARQGLEGLCGCGAWERVVSERLRDIVTCRGCGACKQSESEESKNEKVFQDNLHVVHSCAVSRRKSFIRLPKWHFNTTLGKIEGLLLHFLAHSGYYYCA